MVLPIPQYSGGQADKLTITRKNIASGINNRQHASIIKEDQVENLINADIIIPGLAVKRAGTNLIEDLSDEGQGGFGWEPVAGTNEIIFNHGASLSGSTDASSFTEHKDDFTADLPTYYLKVTTSDGSSRLIVQNLTDNPFEMDTDHVFTELSDADGPVKTSANAFYRNRWWTLKDEQLAFSDAAPASYQGAFGNLDYTIPVGDEVAIIPVRNEGLFIVGSLGVYGLNPATVPAVTDKPQLILDIPVPHTGTAGPTKTFRMVGDDIFGLFSDGIRAIKRTVEDTLQIGTSFPLSYLLKDEFESINWDKINLATAEWFDNKYILALPVDGSEYNNEVWVYYPATEGWTVWKGWNVADWSRVTINGQEKLFYIDAVNGAAYEALTGDNDEDNSGDAVAISYTEEGRKEDLGDLLRRKNTGEVTIRAEATGGTLTVKSQYDDGGYQTLGTMSLTGNLLDFTSWTLPFTFKSPNVVYKKFHLDDAGSWYQIQLKLEHSTVDDLKILERTIRAYQDQYIDEEEA